MLVPSCAEEPAVAAGVLRGWGKASSEPRALPTHAGPGHYNDVRGNVAGTARSSSEKHFAVLYSWVLVNCMTLDL